MNRSAMSRQWRNRPEKGGNGAYAFYRSGQTYQLLLPGGGKGLLSAAPCLPDRRSSRHCGFDYDWSHVANNIASAPAAANLRQAVSLKKIGAGGKEGGRMNFAEDIAWILIVCAIIYPLCAIFFVPAHFYKKKDAERERLHGFSKSDRHRTAEDSDQAFLPLFYDIPIRVYGLRLSKKPPASIWPIIRRRRRSELRWRFTLTHLIRKNTSVPPMSRCIG